MNKLTLLFFGLLTLAGSSLVRSQVAQTSTPYVYVIEVADTAARSIDIYDRAGGYARSLAMGAGGFGMINSEGAVLQGTAVGFQSYIANPFLIDPIDVVFNPAWASHYKDLTSLNISPQFVNAAFSVSPDFSLGLMLAKKSFPGLSIATTLDTGITKNVVDPYTPNSTGLDNTTYIYSALQLGSLALGLGVSYVSAGYQNTPPADSIKSTDEGLSQLGINLGILAAVSKDFKIDGALTIMFPSYSDKLNQTIKDAKGVATTYSETYSDKRTIFGFNGRAIVNSTSNFALIPMVDFYSMSGSSTDTHPVLNPSGIGIHDTTISPTMASHTSFDVGIGANYIIGDLLLVGGVSLGSYSETKTRVITGVDTADMHTSQLIFPRWNLGAEYRIEKHVKIRAGYAVSNGTQNTPSRYYSADGKTVGSISQTIRDPYFSASTGKDAGLSVGVGFVYEKFFMDLAISNLSTSSLFSTSSNSSSTGVSASLQLGFVFGTPTKP